MANVIQLGLRAAEFLFALLVMSLVGNMIDTSFSGNPSIVNYSMFCAVFAMLTLFYLITIAFKEQFTFHKFVPAGLDLLNALFWFCAAVALAAELNVHSCSNQVCYDYYDIRDSKLTKNSLMYHATASQTVLQT
ncbi:hypothetical protein LTR24_003754 [Lithohypha guttulata]|uniref:MARVEL domain-containing protein n=1 Tax=Lithohypha guttulata TaxID=1690604 RepID=A0ABR0KF02_9EURO|nr:hypothetical protein LTR24_003754 [Lithohypha guttulata]